MKIWKQDYCTCTSAGIFCILFSTKENLSKRKTDIWLIYTQNLRSCLCVYLDTPHFCLLELFAWIHFAICFEMLDDHIAYLCRSSSVSYGKCRELLFWVLLLHVWGLYISLHIYIIWDMKVTLPFLILIEGSLFLNILCWFLINTHEVIS